MTLPFGLALPDWVPGWVPVVLLIPLVLYGLLALAVPFAVLGTRARLEALESQIDDLHAELRILALHLGPPPEPRLGQARLEQARLEQARLEQERRAEAPEGLRAERRRPPGTRAEPRIGWPRAADD